jgi:hypothetical protein
LRLTLSGRWMPRAGRLWVAGRGTWALRWTEADSIGGRRLSVNTKSARNRDEQTVQKWGEVDEVRVFETMQL